MLGLRLRAEPRSRLPQSPGGLDLDGGKHGGIVFRAGTHGATDRSEPRAGAAIFESDFSNFENVRDADFQESSRSIAHDRANVWITIVVAIASGFDSS